MSKVGIYAVTYVAAVHDETLLLAKSREQQMNGDYDHLTAEEFEAEGDETVEGALKIIMGSEVPPLDAGFEITDTIVEFRRKIEL